MLYLQVVTHIRLAKKNLEKPERPLFCAFFERVLSKVCGKSPIGFP